MFDDDMTLTNYVLGVGGGMGGAVLGFETLCNLIGDKVNPDALLTTTEAIGLIGGTALTALLGLTAGTLLSIYVQDKMDEYGVLDGIFMAVIGTPIEMMIKAIGNAKAPVKEKAQQIAQAINQKAKQIVDKVKNKTINKNNENTLSK